MSTCGSLKLKALTLSTVVWLSQVASKQSSNDGKLNRKNPGMAATFTMTLESSLLSVKSESD